MGPECQLKKIHFKKGVFSHKKQCNSGLMGAGLVCVLLFANKHCLKRAKKNHHCLGWLASYVNASFNYTAEPIVL
jgi:hypothetical protein